jgi:8-oxo-dGTP pyrophosphatase MutT (NUDIX family)
VLDPDDRVLLVHMTSPEGWDGWITPGGALEEGETPEQAALRELMEECGLCDVELGPKIWFRTTFFPFKGVEYEQRESFYLVRVTGSVDFAPTFTREQLAEEGVGGHQWWSLDELDGVMTGPRGLASLVRRLVAEGPPAEPFDAGR